MLISKDIAQKVLHCSKSIAWEVIFFLFGGERTSVASHAILFGFA
jgi:hypothetical protein